MLRIANVRSHTQSLAAAKVQDMGLCVRCSLSQPPALSGSESLLLVPGASSRRLLSLPRLDDGVQL